MENGISSELKEGERRSFFYYSKKMGILAEKKTKNRLTSAGKGTLITHSCGLVFFVCFSVGEKAWRDF